MGAIICPTLPCSSLGLTEGSGLPTRPETRANWLGEIRPACGAEGARVRRGPSERCGAGGAQSPGLYLCSSQQLRPLQVGENGRDTGGEWVAQQGRVLRENKGAEPPVMVLPRGMMQLGHQGGLGVGAGGTGTLQSWLGDILSP